MNRPIPPELASHSCKALIIVVAGIVESRGEKKGRAYRISTDFSRKAYGRELLAE